MINKFAKICTFIFVCAALSPVLSETPEIVPAAPGGAAAAEETPSETTEAVVPAAAEPSGAEAPVTEVGDEASPPPPSRSAASETAAIGAAGSAAGAASTAAAKLLEEERLRKEQREKSMPVPKTIIVPSSQAKTIAAAMAGARPGDTVKVKNGRYREAVFVSPGVVFMAENRFKAILDGRGKRVIVTMGTASVISGFEIRNGTIGVFSASGQAVVRQCRIMQNIQSGIMCVGVLPRIEDNVIVHNKGSGIQGWDVRTTSGSINHNTIVYNANHGIALGGNTSITIENNIIAYNDQFGVKPGEETVRVVLVNNNFFQNAKISSSLPSDNLSADPLFNDAKRLDFGLRKESRSIGQGTDNQNLGARILH